MPPSVFISYNRSNTPFADRLYHDLKRAGMDAWLDSSDIPSHSRWRPEIQAAIQRATHFLLLASPESAESPEVAMELAEAEKHHKPILTLRVAGAYSQLPEKWRDQQCLDFRDGYAERLASLVRELKGTSAVQTSAVRLLYGGQMRVADAAAELTGGLSFFVGGRDYLGLPIEPSGYTMTWLVGPADARLAPPDRLAVLLKFTGPASRSETAVDVIQFLCDTGVEDVWLVYVRGPKSEDGRYELRVDAPHVWEDAAHAAARALQLPFVKGKDLHLFLESPATLIYAVAGQLRDMGRCHLYQFDYQSTGADRYRRVIGPRQE